jgi:hypothetical protein
VGGNTKGSATSEATGARQAERVCASHHATGVASNSSKTVVTLASCSVSAMAWKSSALKFMPTLYKA